MTLQQTEQWQKAMMRAYPAPVPNGQECSFEHWRNHRIAEAAMIALLPESERIAFLKSRVKGSVEHLADWHLPEWVLEIRKEYTRWGHTPQAELVFRSDVALIGIQLRYPTLAVRTKSYERLLISFLPRVLRLLVEKAEANHDTDLRHDFEGYFQICQLCESGGLYQDPQRWLDIKNNFGISRGRKSYKSRAIFMVDGFARLACRVLFQIDEPGPLRSIGHLLFYLPSEYEAIEVYGHHVAPAFAEALETECPPPDWLP